jgi:hypothetical protein
MRYRFLSLAVLAGIALALLTPVSAQPAAADDSCSAGYDCVDCSVEIVFDPSFCRYPPEEPPPPPPANTMGPMGPGTPVPPSPNPGMMPNLPGEVCDRTRSFSDRAGIIESGVPDKLVYTFNVTTTFCTLNRVITKARITADIDVVEPVDGRITSIELITPPMPQGVTGGPTLFQAENVITELCPGGAGDPVNCRKFRHIYTISIDARSSSPLSVEPLPISECSPAGCF